MIRASCPAGPADPPGPPFGRQGGTRRILVGRGQDHGRDRILFREAARIGPVAVHRYEHHLEPEAANAGRVAGHRRVLQGHPAGTGVAQRLEEDGEPLDPSVADDEAIGIDR